MPLKALPLVSIGMPVKNVAHCLIPALRSLQLQSLPDWELLLIDDGSRDATVQIAARLQDPRIKIYADGRSLGLARRLNQAVSLSRGRFFARMDGDDVAYPRRLERQVGFLAVNPELDLMGSSMMVFGDAAGHPLGKRPVPATHDAICRRPRAGFPLFHPTFLGKTAWFRQHGYRSLPKAQDQDLLLRTYRVSRFANVPDILLGYREEKVDLRKILTGRRLFSRSLLQEFRRQGKPATALRAVLEQACKGLADLVAVTSGLNYKLLRHRARPAAAAELAAWQAVWRQVNTPLGEER